MSLWPEADNVVRFADGLALLSCLLLSLLIKDIFIRAFFDLDVRNCGRLLLKWQFKRKQTAFRVRFGALLTLQRLVVALTERHVDILIDFVYPLLLLTLAFLLTNVELFLNGYIPALISSILEVIGSLERDLQSIANLVNLLGIG